VDHPKVNVNVKGQMKMKRRKPPVGIFVKSKLDAAKRQVAKSRNAAGYARIYPDVARAVVSEYPVLTAAEKRAVFDSLEFDAEQTKVRARVDSASGLTEASKILGI
jgi:hypothetical protein